MYRPLIAVAFALTALAAPALAVTDTFKMDVEFSRAKLATAEGASAEYAKIRDQVVDRCEVEHEDMRFGQAFAIDACTKRTLGNAVRQIANPALTAVHTEAKG